MKKFLVLVFFLTSYFLILNSVSSAEEEQISILTYYPAPYGAYKQLTTTTLDITPGSEPTTKVVGRIYFDSSGTLKICNNVATGYVGFGGGPWVTSGDNIYYPADPIAKPAAKVGIGVTAPLYTLHVVGVNAPAIMGASSTTGVIGSATATSGIKTGVSGSASGNGENRGVYGEAFGGTNRAVYGVANTGYAGYFNGNVYMGSTVDIARISVPSPFTDKLYNVGGALYWNGSALATGGAGSFTYTGTGDRVAIWQNANYLTYRQIYSVSPDKLGIGIYPSHQLELGQDDAWKPISNTWKVVSDRRIKKDIKSFTDGLNVITKINPVSYKLNGKAGTPKDAPGISVIAQDVKDIIPYTISTYKAKLEPTDAKETELYDFNSSPLTFVMINAIKEQQKQIEDLKAENKNLISQNKEFDTRIRALEGKLSSR